MKATLIIINYNGRALLAQSVPAALEAARQAGPGHVVMVSDDASADGSVDFVRERFPEARTLANPKGGFGVYAEFYGEVPMRNVEEVCACFEEWCFQPL